MELCDCFRQKLLGLEEQMWGRNQRLSFSLPPVTNSIAYTYLCQCQRSGVCHGVWILTRVGAFAPWCWKRGSSLGSWVGCCRGGDTFWIPRKHGGVNRCLIKWDFSENSVSCILLGFHGYCFCIHSIDLMFALLFSIHWTSLCSLIWNKRAVLATL